MRNILLAVFVLGTLYIAYGQDRGHNGNSVTDTVALPVKSVSGTKFSLCEQI